MVVAATVVAVVALWVWLALLPGVGDAPARLAAIMRVHHARAVHLPASARIARSVVAVEDQRFYSHRGIDSRSLLRVALHTPSGSGDQGGATIDQQLAKLLYTGDHWGVAQASTGYFDKPPTALSWGEASLLAGLLRAPSAYDPRHHLEEAQRRQRHVLDRLVATGTLSRAQADAAYRDLAREGIRHGFQTRPA